MKRECETCIKRKTIFCPTSMECMATDDMPYYRNRMMLLKENKQQKDNWNNLKEWLEKSWEESQDIWFVKIINKMHEIERGNKFEK